MKVNLPDIDPRRLTDVNQLQDLVVQLLNICDHLLTQNEALEATIVQLKDEINILKGEHKNPKFPPSGIAKQPLPDTGQPRATSKRGNHKKGSKKNRLSIDHVENITLPRSALPEDAVLKEYKTYIQQNLCLRRHNVKYRVAIYHSPREGKTYRGDLPPEYRGEFGTGLISLTHLLSHGANVTQGRLETLYRSLGIDISSGTISHILTHQADWVLGEQQDILRQGIGQSAYTQMDGTKSVERGKGMVTQIIAADKFTVFLTLPGKSRLDILSALQGKPSAGLRVCYNEHSLAFLRQMKVSGPARRLLPTIVTPGQPLGLEELLLAMKAAAGGGFNEYNQIRISHALALSYYVAQQDFPVVEWLLSDDAGEYTKVARAGHGLCWIHDARNYRKLIPRTEAHKELHAAALAQYWAFYAELQKYRTLDAAGRWSNKPLLLAEFDRLFRRQTDYHQLNTCLERTLANKDQLLAVLDNPALPLHNNAAELGARRVVRKRDISLHTWSAKGTSVRDAFMSLIDTAEKLGVNALSYIDDRISGHNLMPSLANRIVYQKDG